MANFPTELVMSSTDIKSSDTGLVITDSEMTGARFIRSRANQRWSWDVTFAQEAKLAIAKVGFVGLAAYHFGLNIITIIHPLYVEPEGATTTEVLTVSAATAAGATSVPITGWGGALTNALLPGDLIQFAVAAKVYMVTAAATASGGGAAVVSIYPALRQPLLIASAVKVNDIEFNMYVDDEEISMNLRAPNTATHGVLTLIEAI